MKAFRDTETSFVVCTTSRRKRRRLRKTDKIPLDKFKPENMLRIYSRKSCGMDVRHTETDRVLTKNKFLIEN